MVLRKGTIRMLKNMLDRISLALILFLTMLIYLLAFVRISWPAITALSLFIAFLIAIQTAIFMTIRDQ